MKTSTLRIAPSRRSLLAGALTAGCLCLTPPAVAGDYRHVVRPGDTLIGVGAEWLRNPVDWKRLQRLNRVADPHRLRPGSTLRIPEDWLRREPTVARATAVRGEVRVGGTPLAVGDTVTRGSELTTGDQSFVTVTLADGSRLVLQPGSRLKVEEMARQGRAQVPQTQLRLDAGRVESVVTKSAATQPRYTVTTPTATIGVRGTSFRVAVDEAGAGTRAEVTEGTVGVGSAGGGRHRQDGQEGQVAVAAGYGLVAPAGAEPSKPVALLPAPEVAGLPRLQDRTVVRFAVPPLADASRYRFQVGGDAAMSRVLAESVGPRPEAKFAELPDGDYVVRVRAIDAKGLEGRDADAAFRLKARPEPPFAVSPVGGGKLRGESPELSWAANPEAAAYRVQLAADGRFAKVLADIDPVSGTTVMPAKKLPPGDYFWRARSVRAGGDAGPWGDAQRFALRPLPAEPEPPRVGDDAIDFAWSGEPGQTFLFQFARDAAFADIVAERQLDRPATTLVRPDAGRYHMRVRATDADDFVGPFTTPQTIEVPPRPLPWWLLLFLLPVVL